MQSFEPSHGMPRYQDLISTLRHLSLHPRPQKMPMSAHRLPVLISGNASTDTHVVTPVPRLLAAYHRNEPGRHKLTSDEIEH
jgi:hypothetical protein